MMFHGFEIGLEELRTAVAAGGYSSVEPETCGSIGAMPSRAIVCVWAVVLADVDTALGMKKA